MSIAGSERGSLLAGCGAMGELTVYNRGWSDVPIWLGLPRSFRQEALMAIDERKILTDDDISTVSVRQAARPSIERGTVGTLQADKADADGGDADGGDADGGDADGGDADGGDADGGDHADGDSTDRTDGDRTDRGDSDTTDR